MSQGLESAASARHPHTEGFGRITAKDERNFIVIHRIVQSHGLLRVDDDFPM